MRTLVVVLALIAEFALGFLAGRQHPAPAKLIPPTSFVKDAPRAADSAASRDLNRAWLAFGSPLMLPQEMIPDLPPSVTPSSSALATPSTSPKAIGDASQDASVATLTVAARGPVVAGEGATGPSAKDWATLRRCESGDQYGNKHNPRYRGAYQIGFAEWKTYGGTGRDPADASPAEQDAVALRLWQARGWQPWASSAKCSGLS